MVGHYIQAFLRQAQTLALHAGSDHLEGLASADTMGQQGIPAIQDMGHRIFLVLHQGDLRRHTHKADVRAIIFTGADAVKHPVIGLHQIFPAIHIPENPFLECLLDGVLFLLGQHRLIFVEHPMLIPVYITLRVIDFGVPQVQGIFQQPVGIGAGGAKGGIDQRIIHIPAFARHIPCAGHIGIGYRNNSPRHIPRRVERLLHKFLDIFRLDPGCAKANLDFRCIQVFGLYPFQIGNIDGKFRVILCKLAGHSQLFADVAGKVFIRHFPLVSQRIFENHACQFLGDFVLGFPRQLRHKGHIHLGTFPDGYRQRLAGRVHTSHSLWAANGALCKDVGFPLQFAFFVQNFQGSQQAVAAVLRKSTPVGVAAD